MARLSELFKQGDKPLKVTRNGYSWFEVYFVAGELWYFGLNDQGLKDSYSDRECDDWQEYKEPAPKLRVWVGDLNKGYKCFMFSSSRPSEGYEDITKKLAEALFNEINK